MVQYPSWNQIEGYGEPWVWGISAVWGDGAPLWETE
jgi:hypothetical protein